MSTFTGAKWGPGEFGTAGGTVTWSFAQISGTILNFAGAISEAPFQQAVRSAFDTWDRMADIEFREIADGLESNIRLGWSVIDGVQGTLGSAAWEYLGGQLIRAEINFDLAEPWDLSASSPANNIRFETVALHEIGHAIGLGHTDDASSLMYAYLSHQKHLSLSDSEAVVALYGAEQPNEISALPEGFRGLEYIASYGDLIQHFGADADAGAAHYINHGVREGRQTSFDGLEYIASYGDLIGAFGADADAGALHFIEHGMEEGRSTSFDGLEYIASYGDLIRGFGANAHAGARHYVNHGTAEGRSNDLFDAEGYLDTYADLQAAFGDDVEAATQHYIEHGYWEGRTDHFIL